MSAMSLVRASLIFGILPVATAARRSGFDSDEFKLGGRSAPQTQIPFSVGLSYDSAPLAERLAAASDIESPRYGEWLQDDEVVSLAWADPSVRERVREWLAVREVRCVGRPTSLACSATASVIEEVFSTELSSYAFTDSRGEPAVLHRVAPSTAFSLPAGLVAAGARFTSQLLDFPTRRRRLGSVSRITASGTTDPGVSLIALESLAAMYGSVPSSVGASAAATTSASPAEFQGDAAVAAADLRDFISQEGARPWSIARKVGPFAGSDTESTLDEEMLGGASNSSASVAQWFWVEHGWMFEWTEALKNTSRADIPDVFSVRASHL